MAEEQDYNKEIPDVVNEYMDRETYYGIKRESILKILFKGLLNLVTFGLFRKKLFPKHEVPIEYMDQIFANEEQKQNDAKEQETISIDNQKTEEIKNDRTENSKEENSETETKNSAQENNNQSSKHEESESNEDENSKEEGMQL